MPYGSASCSCHNCGKRWLGGCVIRFTCDDCAKLGHNDGLIDCPACEKASKDGFIAALDSIVKQRDTLLEALDELVRDCRSRGHSGLGPRGGPLERAEAALNTVRAQS